MAQNKMNSEVKKSNREIKDATRYKLWAVSAGRCQICNRIVYTDSTFGLDGNFGELAHIHAVGENGPRHLRDMTPEELNSTDNLMLLCQEHHKMIDDNPNIFSGEYLREKKRNHEIRINNVTNIVDLTTCIMVSYCTKIDENEIVYNENDFRKALMKENLIPEQEKCIDLASIFQTSDRTKERYEFKANELVMAYKRKIETITKTKECIAIFALGPMPLLIKLGTLINDQYNTRVFQRHREGEIWSWKDTNDQIDYNIKNIESISKNEDTVAINISLSAEINNNRIIKVIGTEIPIVTFTLTHSEPNRNFVTREDISDSFVKSFRIMLEKIKCISNPKKIMLFPSMPSSLAVRLGQDYMKKTDPEIVIYDQDGKSFIETITIGDDSYE